MSLTGNISTMSLAEIFQWLNIGRKTGTLHVEGSDGLKKDVYFGNGMINSAVSNDPRELIGQFLLMNNKISEQQLLDALERQNRDYVQLGKILVQQKIMSKDDLVQALTTISEEIIFDLFLWKEGQFQFLDGILPQRDLPALALDITHIVLEGARREDEWARINEVFTTENIVVRLNSDRVAERLPMESPSARLLSYVNGSRTLHDITRMAKGTKFNIFKQLLDFYEFGLLEIGDFQDQIIQPVVLTKRDPIRDSLAHVEALLRQGRLEDAEKAVFKLERQVPANPDVKKIKRWIEEKKLETTAKRVIRQDAVAVLAMDMNKITKLDLSPEEGFVISRINGSFDVKTIIRLSPFDEALCLKILKQFMDDGIIIFK